MFFSFGHCVGSNFEKPRTSQECVLCTKCSISIQCEEAELRAVVAENNCAIRASYCRKHLHHQSIILQETVAPSEYHRISVYNVCTKQKTLMDLKALAMFGGCYYSSSVNFKEVTFSGFRDSCFIQHINFMTS